MTLRHLTIFAAVVDAGGMNKAAKVLHLSQPSISQAVAELEQHYGVKLFERLSQRLYLTKDGELLLSFCASYSGFLSANGSDYESENRKNAN